MLGVVVRCIYGSIRACFSHSYSRCTRLHFVSDLPQFNAFKGRFLASCMYGTGRKVLKLTNDVITS